jgi:hypothetical protein
MAVKKGEDGRRASPPSDEREGDREEDREGENIIVELITQ